MKCSTMFAAVVGVGGLLTQFAGAQLTPTPPIPPGNLFFDYFLFDNNGQPAQNFGSSILPTEQFLLWTVSDGTVDLVGGNVPGADDLPNGRYVDLDGSTNNSGRFTNRTPIPLLPGQRYELFFEYFSTDGNANSATVTVAGRDYVVSTSSSAIQNFSVVFTNDNNLATTSISFQDSGNDSAGIGIDAVLFNQVLVPEPGTLALLAGGAALALRRRRA